MQVNSKMTLWKQFKKYSAIIAKEKNYKSKRQLLMQSRSEELNSNLPKSEVWFWSLFRNDKLNLDTDIPNVPIKNYIYDVINHRYFYMIEIDGSSHDNEKQIKRDRLKDNLCTKMNYLIIRIKAYDLESYHRGIALVLKRRAFFDKGKYRKTILRKNSTLE